MATTPTAALSASQSGATAYRSTPKSASAATMMSGVQQSGASSTLQFAVRSRMTRTRSSCLWMATTGVA